jgi:[ribosomal protein S5]-alanine N-acetyltransferase
MVLESNRLILRNLTIDDAAFVLRLLNEPSFHYYIGDKGVRELEDARLYLLSGPLDSYERYGFGLLRVELKETGVPIGLCGLLKRETLPEPDLGFAFFPEYWSSGYATEASAAAIEFGQQTIGLTRILGITSPDNAGSKRVLEKNGFKFAGMKRLTSEDPEVCLFVWESVKGVFA